MYDNSMKYRWDNQHVLDYAVSEAVKKAKEETREEDRLRALEDQDQKMLSIGRELKKEGLAFEFIAKITNLSFEEIENL